MDLDLVKGDLPPLGSAALELVDIDLANAEMVRARETSPAAALSPRRPVAPLFLIVPRTGDRCRWSGGRFEQAPLGVSQRTSW